MSEKTISDPRPHMLPGIYSWMAENFNRVYIAADINHPLIQCPKTISSMLVETPTLTENAEQPIIKTKRQIVTLNFGVEAIGNFYLDDCGFYATMRFNRVAHQVFIPFSSIYMIYSPDDTNASFNFAFREDDSSVGELQINKDVVEQETQTKPVKRNHLTLVKG